MFGIGFTELCVIALFILIIFGPEKLPELLNQLGKFLFHTRRMSNELKANVEGIIEQAERDTENTEVKRQSSSCPEGARSAATSVSPDAS